MEATQNFDTDDSIELKMNAKKEFSWNIKLYFDENEQGHNATIAKMADINSQLTAMYL